MGYWVLQFPIFRQIYIFSVHWSLFAKAGGFILLRYAICARRKWSCGQIITAIKDEDFVLFHFVACDGTFYVYVTIFFKRQY